MSTNDSLEALFASIKPRSRDPSAQQQSAPSTSMAGNIPMSSPPPLSAVNPATMPNDSSTAAPAARQPSNNTTAQSLLNLLNFGSATQNAPSAAIPPPDTAPPAIPDTPSEQPETPRAVSASDLVARFMSPPATAAAAQAQSPLPPEDLGGGGTPQPSSTGASEDALLKLLSKAKSASDSRPASTAPSRSVSRQQNGTAQSALADAAANAGLPPKPIFTYTNPFEQLHASRQQTPKTTTPAPEPPQSPIFKNISDIPQPSIETPPPETKADVVSDTLPNGRRKLTPRSASARVERIVRENSMKLAGTPEPEAPVEEATAAINPEVTLPIRPAEDAATKPAPADAKRENVKQEDLKQEDDPAKDTEPNGDEWEDEEESPADDEPRRVPVLNFPIKPFVSLTLQLPETSEVSIRQDGVMEISRLKKDFDQQDRSLAAATTKYIAYSLTKNGGIRIIRQDDGSDRQVFKNSHDRVFNVGFCSTAANSPPLDEQAVLGTGVSGTVYYATIFKDGNDLFEKNELDSESLAFPPWPAADEHSAGGVLKTRAKRSSKHPEYFAIGRGKSIHLIWPATVMSSKYGITPENNRVDMDKLYQERNLSIATGKAGKDFAFSEDDTLIISLDKTGRLRFWDIQELTQEANATALRVNPVKVDTPLLSLHTASPAEKSWPTSVTFVDKLRPYLKGGALRYVLVGLRQNHTLQLWDLALGKAVQELNFPHDNEADGICSVNYHPGTGIIVVGHPTRNSLFFIHLSAPRYALSSSISQASYIQRIAAGDPDLPKPESTACMSGVRELSFASKGQLRSVELLTVHKLSDAPKPADATAAQFELYVVHSKGVTCLTISKEDLGWDASNKVIHGVDAVKEGYLDSKELKLGTVMEEPAHSRSPPEESSPATTAAPSSTKSKKKSKKTALATDSADVPTPEPELEVPVTNGATSQVEILSAEVATSKEVKKSKKKSTIAETSLESATDARAASPVKVPAQSIAVNAPTASAPQIAKAIPVQDEWPQPQNEKISIGISGDWLDKELVKLSDGLAGTFHSEFKHLRSNIQQDRIVQDTAAASRQEAVMRLVSQTLTNNVERTMANIVAAQVQQVVVPAISSVTAQVVRDEVGGQVVKFLKDALPREFGAHLPVAVKSALSSPQLSQSLYESIAGKITKQVETQMGDFVKKQIIPTFEKLSATAAIQAAHEVASRVQTEINRFEEDRKRDTARIEQLNSIVSGMAETLQTMSRTQVAFQNQLLTARPISTSRVSPSPAPIARPIPVKPKTKQELELEEIANIMESGKYEEGSIRWLHSENQVELFDGLFVRYTPDYLSTDVSPLVAFSIAITVAKSLNTNAGARLEWIGAAFDAVDLSDPEIADLSDHAPMLLSSLIQKLESMYMTMAEADINNPVIRQIPPTVKKARAMRDALGGDETTAAGGVREQAMY